MKTKRFFVALVTLAAVAICWFAPALCFPAGLPFYNVPEKSRDNWNEVLALRIQKSLVVKKDGTGVIDGATCTTPNIIFETIKKYHPSADLKSVGDLSAYIAELGRVEAPKGKITLTRIIKNGNKTSVGVWAREAHKGEYFWYDLSTGELIMAGYCSNIVVPEPKKAPTEKPTTQPAVVKDDGFQYCSEFVAPIGQHPIPPYAICSATKFVELLGPGEMVPIVYGLCDSTGKSVYHPDLEIIIEDYSENGNDLLQDETGLKLVRPKGCTQVMIKRGNDFRSLDPFDPDKANGGSNEIIFTAEKVNAEIEPLRIPWEVDVQPISKDDPILTVLQIKDGVIAKISQKGGGFVPGVLTLHERKGRQDPTVVRTNFIEGEDGSLSYNFGKLPKGRYLVVFSQAVLKKDGQIYLVEKKSTEIVVE